MAPEIMRGHGYGTEASGVISRPRFDVFSSTATHASGEFPDYVVGADQGGSR